MIAAALPLLWSLAAAPARAGAAPDAAALVSEADALWKRNERAKAERRLRKALRLSPDDFAALDRLTELLRERDRPEESLALADRLVTLPASTAARRAEGRRQRGETLLVLGRYAEAEAEGRAALAAVPGDFAASWLLARVALGSGKPDAASEPLAAMERSAATAGQQAQAAWLRAQLRAAPDEELERQLKLVLVRDPGALPALEALNAVLQRGRRYDEALAVGQRYVDASTARGERSAGYLMRGETFLLMGKPRDAESSARSALAEDADSLPAFWQLARALKAQGRDAAARRALKRMESLARTEPEKTEAARRRASFELQ